jgi:hypothetical protein
MSIDIRFYDQAKELINAGYMPEGWTVEQVAKRLSEQEPIEIGDQLDSRKGTLKEPKSQDEIDKNSKTFGW